MSELYISSAALAAGYPDGTISATMPRASVIVDHTLLVSGRLQFATLYLPQGSVVTNIAFRKGGTAGATLTHCWFALYTKVAAPALLAVTADDTSANWTTADRTLALSSPFLVTESKNYLVGICVVGGTMPSICGGPVIPAVCNTIGGSVFEGASSGSLTDPASAPNPAAGLTAIGQPLLSWVS